MTVIKIDNNIELRQLEESDAVEIFKTIDSQRNYLGIWLPFVETTRQISDTENFVKSTINVPEGSSYYVFTIRVRHEFAGLIGLHNTDKMNRKTEIGYWLSETYQKQGIMTRSVEALCDFAFNELGMNRIQIKCAVGNTPSIKIPQRLGFIFEGIERQGELLTGNIFTDLKIYSKLRHDEQ